MNHLTKMQSQGESTSPVPLPNWSSLSAEQQAFAAAYVETGYSISGASEATALSLGKCKSFLANPVVRKGIHELQNAVGDIDFMNEKWVREQLLKLYPKLVGEEEVPLLDNSGMQIEARKFYPEAALKVLEYVAPKQAAKSSGGVNVAVRIDMGALGIQTVEVTDGNS